MGLHKLPTALGAFCLALLLFFLSNQVSAGYENGIPVLLYHHVSDDPGDEPELTISTEEFSRQMAVLRTLGFETISSEELAAYFNDPEVRLPSMPIVITFDDGYEDNYTYAFPILQQYGFQADIFMVGINFDRKNRLSVAEVRTMVGRGIGIGAHSMTHANLENIPPKQRQWEISACKQKAEQATGQAVRFFAYPGGYYNADTVEMVRMAGYQGAFTTLTGLNRRDRDSLYTLRRIPVFDSTDFDDLAQKLAVNHPKTSMLDY